MDAFEINPFTQIPDLKIKGGLCALRIFHQSDQFPGYLGFLSSFIGPGFFGFFHHPFNTLYTAYYPCPDSACQQSCQEDFACEMGIFADQGGDAPALFGRVGGLILVLFTGHLKVLPVCL
ncbi:MAG: hypothetical protein BroJett011_59540 [Chloroflexota bacterium]|nr:MAG: hypothetical protein BroJett011_59540 [Chloroflexota bacterium]